MAVGLTSGMVRVVSLMGDAGRLLGRGIVLASSEIWPSE